FIYGLFILVPYCLGLVAGFFVQKQIHASNTMIALVIASVISSFTTESEYNGSKVISNEIIINLPKNEVWQRLVEPVDFGLSEDFFLCNGVSYPLSMQINTLDNKPVLQCIYSNGI